MSNSRRSTLTDGSEPGRAPRLDVYMSWWGMTDLDLGEGEPLSPDEKARRIVEAGFDGIDGFLPAPEEADAWRERLDRHGLLFGVNAYPKSAAELETFLRAAKAFGRVRYVNAQVLTPFLAGEPAEKLLADVAGLSREYGIPVYVETHRGTITQDLVRTVEYAERVMMLGLTIDYSHYVVAGELHTVSEEAESWLQRLLPRTRAIHGRVSNGEQVQVGLGERGEHPMLRHFERWWRDGMRHWRESAAKGDRLPFVCELGPPPYAITAEDRDGRRRELDDRWKQSLLLAGIARRLWRESAEPSR